MPKETHEVPARYWPTVDAALVELLKRVRRHHANPELPSFPPIVTEEWRDGEMRITLAHGPEAHSDGEEIARQLQASVNILAAVVQHVHGGELKISRRVLEELPNSLRLVSAFDEVEGVQILRTSDAERRGRGTRVLMPGRDF